MQHSKIVSHNKLNPETINTTAGVNKMLVAKATSLGGQFQTYASQSDMPQNEAMHGKQANKILQSHNGQCNNKCSPTFDKSMFSRPNTLCTPRQINEAHKEKSNNCVNMFNMGARLLFAKCWKQYLGNRSSPA